MLVLCKHKCIFKKGGLCVGRGVTSHIAVKVVLSELNKKKDNGFDHQKLCSYTSVCSLLVLLGSC